MVALLIAVGATAELVALAMFVRAARRLARTVARITGQPPE